MTRALAHWALVALAALAPQRLQAQQPSDPRVAPELRVDVITAHQPAVQVGGGVQIPLGYYVRLGVVGAIGARIDAAATRPSAGSRTDGRLDVLARFLLDPFRQTAYGLSVGGGMSVRAEPGDRARPLLLLAVDVEGRRARSGLVPALQLALGGGVRVGLVLRRGALGSR